MSTTISHLNAETFRTKIFDYKKNKEWKFEGDKPAIIDFYADWCAPCKMVAPVLEQIQKDYDEKLNVYKIDTEAEQELAGMFGIQSIPSILFIPTQGAPQMSMGAMPKEAFEKAISDIFHIESSVIKSN